MFGPGPKRFHSGQLTLGLPYYNHIYVWSWPEAFPFGATHFGVTLLQPHVWSWPEAFPFGATHFGVTLLQPHVRSWPEAFPFRATHFGVTLLQPHVWCWPEAFPFGTPTLGLPYYNHMFGPGPKRFHSGQPTLGLPYYNHIHVWCWPEAFPFGATHFGVTLFLTTTAMFGSAWRMARSENEKLRSAPSEKTARQVAMELIKAFCGDAGPLEARRPRPAVGSLRVCAAPASAFSLQKGRGPRVRGIFFGYGPTGTAASFCWTAVVY